MRARAAVPVSGEVRATIIVEADDAAGVARAEAWIAGAEGRATVSDQQGCGCCVLMWEVAGPAGVIDTLPDALRSGAVEPAPAPPVAARFWHRLRGRR